MKHVVSFIKCPLGYVANLAVTVLVHAERLPVAGPAAEWLGLKLCSVCDVLCLRDGVQDEPLF